MADNKEYYKLHRQSVEDLATADETNSPEVSEEELKKYGARTKKGIPIPVRLLFIKFWFPAAVCYFFIWGMGTYLSSALDLLFVTGIALGVVTDILTNNALRFFARVKGENDAYMMFPKKAYYTFPLNIIYAWFLLFLESICYNAVNIVLNSIFGTGDRVYIGIEPVIFGILYVALDSLLIKAKLTLLAIISDARKKTSGHIGG